MTIPEFIAMFRFSDLFGNRSDLTSPRPTRSPRSRLRSLGVEPLEDRRLLAVIPVAPPGQAIATASYTQSTPAPIPDAGSVTSNIVVSGAGSVLHDLNLTTFITHTFSGDLDVTITSPAGTVVTLTSDNGGASDNVFNGTVWDDDANPGGQVPYITNDGMVTDTAYMDGVPQLALTPEQALASFRGENPNGVWKLTVTDDLAADVGTLNSWSLEVSTVSGIVPDIIETRYSNSIPVTIPATVSTVTSTINVSGAGAYISEVELQTFIAHTFSSDLDITITSPSGTVVTLTTDNGSGFDNVFNGTNWDDDAIEGASDATYADLVAKSQLRSEEPLAAFIGENPNGVWTITISDDANVDGGSLNSWSIDLHTTLPAQRTVTIVGDPLNPGSNVLVVIGSDATEAIVVQPVPGNPAQTQVLLGSTFYGPYAANSFGRIEIRALGGHDAIVIDPSITKPAYIYAGAGNDSVVSGGGNDIIYGEAGIDTLLGGAGHDVLLGGDGNDNLYGGAGHDILIGGLGSDWLYGQEGEDFLIGASTRYDANVVTLRGLSQIWSGPTPQPTRRAILVGVGVQLAYLDDGAVDYLAGGTGLDWYLAPPNPDVFLENEAW
jgi:subtilisin-like proprotein convertase family protein